MKRALVLAERAAGLSLRLIAAFNLLFLICFLAALLFAATRANAQEVPACSGKNLLAQMQRNDPALLESIRREAAAVANGNALLWRVEKEGVASSYLYGTMHMSDPRVVNLQPAARSAFDSASTVVIETIDVLDQSKMMAAMLANPDLMMFTDDTTLFSLLSDKDRAEVEVALSARGIPPASVAKMKPWMIASMVALPACELARKAAGSPVLDMELAHQAKRTGKALAGLETVADQLGAMASLPMDFHLRGLAETLALGGRVDDIIETMVVLYLQGEPGMFWPFMKAVVPSALEQEGGYAAFEERMVTTRNRTMAERSVRYLDEGGAFVAVGALHLPGPEGLVALLRQKGYAIEAVD